MVTDIQKALMNLSSVNAVSTTFAVFSPSNADCNLRTLNFSALQTELWHCTEVTELDSSTNGEVLSLIHLKGRVLSSHSDGTIKVRAHTNTLILYKHQFVSLTTRFGLVLILDVGFWEEGFEIDSRSSRAHKSCDVPLCSIFR